MPLQRALEVAREHGADLVEVAPNVEPVVCRLLDYGKFMYEQTKKERESRKHQKANLLKEVRFRPKIDDHDVDFKMKQVEKFLSEGDKVKVTVLFRGREISHTELGAGLLRRIHESLGETATIANPAALEGRRMSMILAPHAQKVVRPHRDGEKEEPHRAEA